MIRIDPIGESRLKPSELLCVFRFAFAAQLWCSNRNDFRNTASIMCTISVTCYVWSIWDTLMPIKALVIKHHLPTHVQSFIHKVGAPCTNKCALNIECPLACVLLEWAWASPTLAWLHCAHVCISMPACLDRPLGKNFKWARIFNITEIELMAIARVQRRLPGIEMTEVEAHRHLTLCLLQIINGRLSTGSINFDHDGLSGRFRM